MTQSLESRLIELLNARLCHDLISPVSAVNNGIELIAEMGDDADGEALGLVATSGKEAARKLRFFRLAFGSARLPSGADAGLAEAREAVLDWPAGERVALSWPAAVSRALPREGVKIAMLLAMAALDCLGGAGTLTMATQPSPGGVLWSATARGPRAAVPADMAAALAGQSAMEDLSPKTAPAAYAALLAMTIGTRIVGTAPNGPGEIRLECLIPVAA
ncbi:MAG: histidine phosphotransferase family protein [Alphaproteobacteria bacterium]